MAPPEPSISNLPPTALAPRRMVPLSLAAIGLLVLINVLWSGSSVASKNALSDFGPITLALVRFLPSGLLLFCIELRQGHRPNYARRDLPPLVALGAFGVALTYVVFYAGVRRTTASDTSLMFACEPLLIALFAVVFLRERLHGVQWVGMFVGIYGIWLIAGQAGGNVLALAGLAIESSVSVVGKQLTSRYRGLTLCASEMLIGSACMAPFAMWECATHPPHVTRGGVLSALFLCLVCSAFCYGVWYRLLERFPVSAMGAFILIQPLFGPVWGWLLRGEPLKRGSAIGGGLVIAGLILTSLVQFGRRRTIPSIGVVEEGS